MTDLRQAIQEHVSDAWNMAGPDPSGVDSLATTWSHLQPASQAHLAGVAHSVIQGLLDDGCLQQPTHDDEGKAVQAVNTLHGLTGDINETTAWINRAAGLAAAGIDEDTLDVLGRISSTQPVTPDDLNKLAAGSIPTPSIDESDEWEPCGRSELRIGDYLRCESPYGTFTSSEPIKWFRLTTQHIDIEFENGSCIEINTTNKTVYRKPKPIVHPDPAEHPVIIVRESTVLPKGSEPQKVVYVRPYYRNDIWNGAPETITDWEPADIVAKVIADE